MDKIDVATVEANGQKIVLVDAPISVPKEPSEYLQKCYKKYKEAVKK